MAECPDLPPPWAGPRCGGGKSVMIYYVYIIQSSSNGRFYIGSCRDLYKRLIEHNHGETRSTRPFRPWVIIYSEQLETRQDAYKRERKIKSYKGGDAFKKLVNISTGKGAGAV